MFLHSRRFSVWLVSFLAVLVVYLIYNRMSRTPPIPTQGRYGEIADVCDSDGQVGMVGNVGVGAVRNAHYTILNAKREVEGEFGFEELLHQDGNEWELEKPYYRMNRRGFKCEIKGDRAKVLVEAAGNRVTPKDGILTGNVTIRISPQRTGAFSEGVIYLDDIVFAGDKSMFSTAGRVEYDSDDARLMGKGMELIYNGDAERLEFLKITKLETLHIKRWSRGTVFSSTSTGSEATASAGPASEGKSTAKSGRGYKCVLDTNVIIETSQERLMAQELSINDISGGGESEDKPNGQAVKSPAGSAVSRQDATSAETAGDVAISCDGSIVILPMDSTMKLKQPPPASAEAEQPKTTADGKTTFYGRRVDYSAATGEVSATGSSQITFDINDTKKTADGGPATVTITAQKQAKFEPASNKVSFEGNCRCVATQADVNTSRQYFVLGDKLDVDLAPKKTDEAGTSLGIKRFAATGGVVHLASTKKMGQHLLGGVELKCTRIDYDAVDDRFVATGPGLIKMDNSQTDEPQKGLGRFSLRRKSYAFLRNFDSLEFDGGGNHLVAYSKNGSMLADFIPISGNGSEDKVAVTASRIEADIIETAGGRTELGALVAKGAVTYEDKDIQCAGGEFVYDADGPAISIRGDNFRPCIFNGAIVDSAWRDPKTGKWKTRLKAPGAIK
ncbi:MAG: hypothetical protein ABII09_11615 [Planctomycetota bacterium]